MYISQILLLILKLQLARRKPGDWSSLSAWTTSFLSSIPVASPTPSDNLLCDWQARSSAFSTKLPESLLSHSPAPGKLFLGRASAELLSWSVCSSPKLNQADTADSIPMVPGPRDWGVLRLYHKLVVPWTWGPHFFTKSASKRQNSSGHAALAHSTAHSPKKTAMIVHFG